MSPPLRTTGHSTGTRVQKTPSVGIRYCRRTVLGRPPDTRFPPSFHSAEVGGTRRTTLHTMTEADNMVNFMKRFHDCRLCHTPVIPESLACFQVLHERHVTLESQFGGIAQCWAAAHQDVIPTKPQRKAITKTERKKDGSWEYFSTVPAEVWALSGAYGRSIVGQSIVWIVKDIKHWEKVFVVLFSVVIRIQKILGIICKEGVGIWNGPCETQKTGCNQTSSKRNRKENC